MEKKKVYMLFGEETVRAFEDYYHDAVHPEDCGKSDHREAVSEIKDKINTEERILVREFDTQAEVDAYFLGMADIDGWEGSLEIFQEEYENLKAIVEDE